MSVEWLLRQESRSGSVLELKRVSYVIRVSQVLARTRGGFESVFVGRNLQLRLAFVLYLIIEET
jgi:hypothetical protein